MDLYLFRPNVSHHYGADPEIGSWSVLWAHFQLRPTWEPWLRWPECEPGLMHLTPPAPAFTEICEGLELMHTDAMSGSDRSADFALNDLERVLLRCDQHNPRRAEAALDERVRAAIAFCGTHLAEQITLDDIAAASLASTSRLAHLFKEQVGCGPIQYLERRRLERAAQLLLTGTMSVAEIGESVGYSDAFYFSTRFRRRFGMSPRNYRDANA